MRGEYVFRHTRRVPAIGSPPLARGIRRTLSETAAKTGITPACAGNTAGGAPDLRCNRDHPRLRGEYLFQRYNGLHSAGSPPLARGIPPGCIPRRSRHRITPACAGNTHRLVEQESGLKDHPRLRGEYKSTKQKAVEDGGSPPLARGIPDTQFERLVSWGITPACAGNTKRSVEIQNMSRDHPRLRGEYP